MQPSWRYYEEIEQYLAQGGTFCSFLRGLGAAASFDIAFNNTVRKNVALLRRAIKMCRPAGFFVVVEKANGY